MGLAGARNSAVTGLQAQSTNISISADNIANASTPGYKAVKGQFSSLVTNSSSSTGYSSGGVTVNAQTFIETQGLVESTGRGTDLAISGTGFFAVQDSSSTLLLSRAGSFDINNKGELVNSAGFTLLGWPLDNDGRRPGEVGNTTNTTAAESTSSLVAIDTNSASGAASATTTVKVGMNVNAGQTAFQGATVVFDPKSTANTTVASTDIIVPAAGMEEGETVRFTANSVNYDFEYGGFAKSADLSDAAVFGASTTSTTFSTSTTYPVLTDKDKFTITTTSSGTVTFTFVASSPDTSSGQFNSFDTLATAINATTGLTARVSGTKVYVSSTIATEAITFADVASSNLHSELGFSDEAAAGTGVNRWNTISGLSTLVNAQTDLNSKITNPSAGATIDIFSKDPLLTLTVTKLHGQVEVNLSSDENGTSTEADVIAPIGDMTIGTSTISFSDGTNTDTFTYGGIETSDQISTTNAMFAATDATTAFSTGATNTHAFTINDGGGATTFTFTATSPNTATGQFNSLTTLATAINSSTDYRAKLVNNRVYVSAVDADLALTFANVNATDFLTEFGFANVLASGTGKRFASITELDALTEAITNFDTTLTTGANTKIAISTTNGNSITIGGASNTDMLVEFGLASGDVGDGFFTEMQIDDKVAASASTATIAVTYDTADITKNMTGGNVSAHFSRNIKIFDSLGTGHDFSLDFLKTGANKWAVEFYALTPADITTSGVPGQLVSGTITFNGDGTLNSVTSALANSIAIPWTTGASSSSITFDFGTAGAVGVGQTDGIRQFDAAYNVEFIEQNGVAAGQFKGITVTEDGKVNANFSNGEIKAIYQLPILIVSNQNALTSKTGNVFSITQASGDANLKVAGVGGAGIIVPGSLEGSTADIAEELTKTIGIQSNYNANATLISTVKGMEEELNRRL